jgi:hypothetical protein
MLKQSSIWKCLKEEQIIARTLRSRTTPALARSGKTPEIAYGRFRILCGASLRSWERLVSPRLSKLLLRPADGDILDGISWQILFFYILKEEFIHLDIF